MSITFAAAIIATDIDVFRLTCESGEVLGEFVGHTNAYTEGDLHALICADTLCQQYGPEILPLPAAEGLDEVTMATDNALDVLAVLGLPGQHEGEIPAALLLDRIDTASAIGFDDAERPEGLAYGPLGVMTTAARRPGYLSERLAALRTLAHACATADRTVVWH